MDSDNPIKRRHEQACLITPLATSFFKDAKQADYIGVDAGVLKILEAGLQPLFAMGDFDSMEGLPQGVTVYTHPVRKDDSDTALAVAQAVEMGYKKIVVYGGLHGRLDHTVANLRMIVWQFPQVELEDEGQRAFVLLPGSYELEPDFKHLSFFAQEPSVLSLQDVEYPLDQAHLDEKDNLTLSNSFLEGKKAKIQVHSGRILCIESMCP